MGPFLPYIRLRVALYIAAFKPKLSYILFIMPKSKNNRKSKKTRSGQSAILTMARNSLDQATSFARTRYTGKSAASNIANDMMFLKSLLNVEEKHNDTVDGVLSVVGTASSIVGIQTVGQGTTSSTRIGDSIKIIRIDLIVNFVYTTGTTSGYTNQIFKWYIVRYKKTPSSSGNTPFGISEFLDPDNNANYSSMSLFNTDTLENFEVMQAGLVDVNIPFSNTTANNIRSVMVDTTHECGFHQTFNGSAASNVTDNMCFFVVTALNPVNTGGSSSYQLNSRMWFVDN